MSERQKVRVKKNWAVKTAEYQECPGDWVLKVSDRDCIELERKDCSTLFKKKGGSYGSIQGSCD